MTSDDHPAVKTAFLFLQRPSTISPRAVRYACVRPLRLRVRGDRGRTRTCRRLSSGGGPRHMLGARHVDQPRSRARSRSQSRLRPGGPVTLFEVDGSFGVMPTADLDEDDVTIIHEYDPWSPAR